MSFAANYSRLTLPIASDVQKQCRYQKSESAQSFITEYAPAELLEACPKTNHVDAWNKKLWRQALADENSMLQRVIAVTALRCYLSNCLEETAKLIFSEYKNKSVRAEQITLNEVRTLLLGDIQIEHQYVLEPSENPKRRRLLNINQSGQNGSVIPVEVTQYFPLSFEVLATWNPDLESILSLRNWAKRKALDVKIMKQLGIDRCTPWYRLNKISQRYLKQFDEYETKYIKIFQQVYQADLHRNRRSNNSRLPEPTQEQLTKIQKLLKIELGISEIETDKVKNDLLNLADDIRRLYLGVPSRRTFSLLEQQLLETNHELELAVEDTLDELGGVACIIQCAVRKIFGRHQESVPSNLERHDINFQEIIYLYYCVGLSQADIARQIDRDQSQVSRLLKPRKYLELTYVECINMVVGSVMRNQGIYFDGDPDTVMELRLYISERFSGDFGQASKLISSRSTQVNKVESAYFQAIYSLYAQKNTEVD